MRPLIGVVIGPEADLSVEELAERIHELLAEDYANAHVGIQLLATEEELRAFQAGHIVLYRKPVKRASSTDVSYRRPDGSVIRREQQTLFDENT